MNALLLCAFFLTRTGQRRSDTFLETRLSLPELLDSVDRHSAVIKRLQIDLWIGSLYDRLPPPTTGYQSNLASPIADVLVSSGGDGVLSSHLSGVTNINPGTTGGHCQSITVAGLRTHRSLADHIAHHTVSLLHHPLPSLWPRHGVHYKAFR